MSSRVSPPRGPSRVPFLHPLPAAPHRHFTVSPYLFRCTCLPPSPRHMCPQLAFCLVACYLETSSELNERMLWGTWPSSRGASGHVQRPPLTLFYGCFYLKDNLR